MTEKSHQPCPLPGCGSSDAYSWNDDRGVGYCQSCGGKTFVGETGSLIGMGEDNKPFVLDEEEVPPVEQKNPLEIPKGFVPVSSSFEEYRGIDTTVAEFYGARMEKGKDGRLRRVYPYPHAEKYRIHPKDFSENRGFKNNHLFGMDKFNAGGQVLTITEGEEDAMAAFQMLGRKTPVVSLPGAGVSKALLENCQKYIDSFSKIVMCTDADEAGESAAQKFAKAFPNKVYLVNLTKHKDANAFLQAGDKSDFMAAWRGAVKYVPPHIYNTKDQFLTILRDEEQNSYIPTGIEQLDDVIKGLMRGHLTIITGMEGQGKTEILRYFEHRILSQYPEVPIAVCHMEESKKTCLDSYLCYEMKRNLRDPDIRKATPQEDIDKAIEKLTKNGNLYLFDMWADEDPFALFGKIRFLTEACGCQYIFLDPIQQLAYGKDGSDMSEEQVLTRMSVQLEKLASEFNVGIVVTAHVNDDGATRSSRMIGKSASVRLDLKRDHMNEDHLTRNTTTILCSKNRPVGGSTGFAGQLLFDTSTFTIKERHQ